MKITVIVFILSGDLNVSVLVLIIKLRELYQQQNHMLVHSTIQGFHIQRETLQVLEELLILHQ